MKDIESLIEESIIPSKLAKLGVEFLEFAESFYENDLNFNEFGLAREGEDFLDKYAAKYGYSKIHADT